MENKRDMKKHVTFVGALHIGFGILKVFGSVVFFFLFSYAQSFVESAEAASLVIMLIKTLVPLLVALGGVLGIVGGIGLISYNKWARIMIIVLSALNCLSVPIGTAKGVYSLWALLQDDTIRLFDEKATLAPIN